MCSIDPSGEECASVFEVVWPRANRWHDCLCCGRRITPGEKYLRVNIVGDQTAYTEKACRECGEVMTRFGGEHRFTPSPSMLWEFLSECVHWGDDSEENHEQWLVDMALMRLRNEQTREAA